MVGLNRRPVFQQIADLLRHDLETGKPAPGETFPSERDLAQRFGVSRPTANKVLSILIAEGLLSARPGVGAIVAPRVLTHEMGFFRSFTEQARQRGLEPVTEVRVFEPGETTALGPCRALVRVRSLGGEVVIFERRWISSTIWPGLTREQAAGSIYAALRDQPGLGVARAEQRASATIPEAGLCTGLGWPVRLACLRVTGVGLLANGSRLWEEDILFRGDRFELHGTLRIEAVDIQSLEVNNGH
jgi:GntR family transcriptional regulator